MRMNRWCLDFSWLSVFGFFVEDSPLFEVKLGKAKGLGRHPSPLLAGFTTLLSSEELSA